MAVIGRDLHLGNSVDVSDTARRSGLYILGKPGMGKSTLLVNLITQDMPVAHSIVFIDPHGEAIRDVISSKKVTELIRKYNHVRLINPSNEEYTIGINPLECKEPARLSARQRSLDKTLDVFRRLWGQDNLWGVYLERILQSALPIFIELQEYTLAELPLFLTNNAFRRYILEKVKYNTHLLDFWQYEFKPEQAQSALNRIGILLSNPYVRDIVGQTETNIDFDAYTKRGFVVLLHLPGTIDLEARRFIGTIFLSELFHALYQRGPEDVKKTNCCLYIDEFHQFATEQFADFILEGRKFGVATTIAHQERGGQFGENRKILGATLACANKIVFQSTVTDARELAPEFAEKPVTLETRLVPEMVICKEPLWDLLRRGHKNTRMQELFRNKLLWLFEGLTEVKNEIEKNHLIRSGYFDEAMLSRDHAALSGIDEKRENIHAAAARGRDIDVSHASLARTEAMLQQAMQAHGLAERTLMEMQGLQAMLRNGQARIRRMERFLVALMEGGLTATAGEEAFAQFLIDANGWTAPHGPSPIYRLYIETTYGDLTLPRTLDTYNRDVLRVAIKYFPKQTEAVYLAKSLQYWKTATRTVQLGYHQTREEPYTPAEIKEQLDRDRAELFEGNLEEVHLYTLPFGVLNEDELAYVRNSCNAEIREQKPSDVFTKIDKCIEICHLLTQPENHILVPSGQYVEKPVQIASTQEMINQATQTLSGLPQYTAYAKILGADEVWKGQIKTNPLPEKDKDNSDVMEQIEQITREKCYRLRSEVAAEIADRRARWRATVGGSPSDEPPPSRARN